MADFQLAPFVFGFGGWSDSTALSQTHVSLYGGTVWLRRDLYERAVRNTPDAEKWVGADEVRRITANAA